MTSYDIELARAAQPTIVRLGQRIAPYALPLRPHWPAGDDLKWKDLARERGIELNRYQVIGINAIVLRRNIAPWLNVLATLCVLHEATGAMPNTAYGQQVGSGHIAFPQSADNPMQLALNANYRMFTTGYAEVKLETGPMPETEIRDYMAYTWGRLALDQVVEMPDSPTALGKFQIGAQQMDAVVDYIEELRASPQ